MENQPRKKKKSEPESRKKNSTNCGPNKGDVKKKPRKNCSGDDMGFFRSIGEALGAILDLAQTDKTCPKCGSHNIQDELEVYGGVEDSNNHVGDVVPSGHYECGDCGHVF